MLISLSGVMAPGPITAVTVGKGSDSPHAGALVAVGHGIIEFPLMISIRYGLGRLLNLSYLKTAIALVGGGFLLFTGIDMIRSVRKVETGSSNYERPPMIEGALLSVGNPYFLIWWATVGAALILRSVNFGVLGFLIFALCHWLCDFLWCYFLSALSFKGGQFFGRGFQQVVLAACGALLLFFGGRFVVDAARMLLA